MARAALTSRITLRTLACMMGVLGIFLLGYLKSRDNDKTLNHQADHGNDRYEPIVMFTFTLIQSFLLFILIIKSPYLYVWESFPKDVTIGFVPEDGRGLSSDLFRAQGFTAHSERGGSAHLIKSFLMRDPLGILR